MDRRAFLGKIGGIGAAGAALTAIPWFEACSPKTTAETSAEKVRIGIIGPGSRGRLHISNLLLVPQAEVVALCDIYQPSLDAALKLVPNARCYKDYRELLECKDIDAVIIAVPLHMHYPIAKAAFEAGKNVLCEKALCYTMEQCLDLYRTGKASGKIFFVGQQRLFDPKYLIALDAIKKGEYGPVVNVRNYWFRNGDWRRPVPSPELERHINWRLYREYSRGLMTELACHQLQNGIFATGMLPTKVMGTGDIVYWKDGREVEDSVCCIYTFPNGVNMTFESVISNKHFGMGEQILCKDGTVDLPQGRFYPEELQKKTAIRQMIADIEKGIFSNPAFAGTSWVAETAEEKNGLAIMPEAVGRKDGRLLDGSLEMLQAFCNACITGKQPERVLEEGYYGTILCLLGDEAILQKKILEFPEEFRI